MRVAITGGSGFIGTNLLEHFLASDVSVINLDPAEPRNSEHVEFWHPVDPLDASSLDSALRHFAPTHLYHLGARTDLRGTNLSDYSWNTKGVKVVLEACRRQEGLRATVFASSRMVCRTGYRPESETDYCPPNPYGESKVQGELLVRNADLEVPWVIVRPTSIWGPWFDVPYRDFFSAIAARRYVHVGNRPVRKSFGYVGNTVQQLLAVTEAAATPPLRGSTIYLADYPPIELRDWADRIAREVGIRRIPTVPRSLMVPAAKAGDALQWLGWSEPPLTSFRLENLLTEMVYDLSPVERLIAVPEFTLDEGISRTLDWMRGQGLLPTGTGGS